MPDVSADGTSIVYASVAGIAGVSLRLIGSDGSNDHWLDPRINTSLSTINGEEPRWAPNGREIAFASIGADRQSSLAIVTNAGAGVGGIATGIYPSWSPDGRRLVFLHRLTYGELDTDPGPIWIADRNGAAEHPVTPRCVFGTGGKDHLAPSAKARAIYTFGGNDVIAARNNRREYVDCGLGADRVVADRVDSVAPSCEVVVRPRRK
jgi:Tol biopolymer transport system component